MALLIVEAAVLAGRAAFAPLRWEHLLVGGVATMVALAVLADARHRFGLGKGWLLALPLATLAPAMGRWGLAVVLFWGLVYGLELRRRAAGPAQGALRCPRCRSASVSLVAPPDAYCSECDHSFEVFD